MKGMFLTPFIWTLPSLNIVVSLLFFGKCTTITAALMFWNIHKWNLVGRKSQYAYTLTRNTFKNSITYKHGPHCDGWWRESCCCRSPALGGANFEAGAGRCWRKWRVNQWWGGGAVSRTLVCVLRLYLSYSFSTLSHIYYFKYESMIPLKRM